MERGILKRLPEILWQHKIDSLSVLVGFTGPGFFEYISKSPAPPSNLRSTFFFFFAFYEPLFSQNAATPDTHKKRQNASVSV